MPSSRGVEKDTGYATRSEKARNPERMSHGRVARKRYRSIDHRDSVDGLGQGRITGHQNRMPAEKNDICSTICQASERIPSANNAGRCQTRRVIAEKVQQNTGLVIDRANRRRGDRRSARRKTRRPNAGIPIHKTRMGSPKRINAGAMVMSKRCLIIWTVRKLWS